MLFEAGVIGLVGSVLGLAGGIGLAYGLRSLLDAMNVGLPSGSLTLTPRTDIVALVKAAPGTSAATLRAGLTSSTDRTTRSG